jgi:hypothetical protein
MMNKILEKGTFVNENPRTVTAPLCNNPTCPATVRVRRFEELNRQLAQLADQQRRRLDRREVQEARREAAA